MIVKPLLFWRNFFGGVGQGCSPHTSEVIAGLVPQSIIRVINCDLANYFLVPGGRWILGAIAFQRLC